ncbi:MAG: leucine-rich repeat protein [Lachnospiraceae bacterium]|nr:leucine-rich repeat protein [Lachnospiraceae bacterium]
MIKQILAGMLSIIVVLSSINIIEPMAAEVTEEKESIQLQEDFVAEGNNGFGNILADVVNNKADQQEENNGCNIFSIRMEGTQAKVSFETTEEAMLVVGIYDEVGTAMLASGKMLVEPGWTEAAVDIDIDKMPEYFYLRGFLVDQINFRPICNVYESPYYTQEMTEFLQKTVDDYDSDRVLNLDEDKTNNYAVYAENVITIASVEGKNVVVSADDENGVYVIKYPTEQILALKENDIFAYAYGNQQVLIVKVASLEINDDTVTITGKEVEIDEAFDAVKIDGSDGLEAGEVDASGCSEGVIYEGVVEYHENEITPYGIGDTVTKDYAFSHRFVNVGLASDHASVTVNGTLTLHIAASLSYLLFDKQSYVELKFDYGGDITIDISGHASGTLAIAKISYSLAGIVNLSVQPQIRLDASAHLEASGKLSGTVGFRCSNSEGMTNITTTPKIELEMKGDYSLYIGLTLIPEVDCTLAQLSLEATVGATLAGSFRTNSSGNSTADMKHDCDFCIGGDIRVNYALSGKVQFFHSDKYSYEQSFANNSVKLTDYYYSLTHGEFGFTTCPHIQYRVTVTVKDSEGLPVSGTAVNGNYVTDENGMVTLWLPSGQCSITVAKGNSVTSRNLEVDTAKNVVLNIDGTGWSSGGGSAGNGNNGMIMGAVGSVNGHGVVSANAGTVDYLVVGGPWANSQVMAVMKDGSIYAWGNNACGVFADGTTTKCITRPIKITSAAGDTAMLREGTVAALALSYYNGAAITKDGDLYIWGDNRYGQLGNGTTGDKVLTPQKVMEHVVQVRIYRGSIAAVTVSGDLYAWGDNQYGRLGKDSSSNNFSSPQKIMSNVVSVDLSEYCGAAITTDRSLYTWGSNYGMIGNGTSSNGEHFIVAPTKILNNVVQVSLGSAHNAAIVVDGTLYTWGTNSDGELGDGTTNPTYTPKAVVRNIAKVSMGYHYTAALTKDGNLYMWGSNLYRQLGIGRLDKDAHPRPIKVLSNIADVNASSYFCTAVSIDGLVYTWGTNSYGQLGNGTMNDVNIPTVIPIPYFPESLFSYRLEPDSMKGSMFFDAENINSESSAFSSRATSKTASFKGLQPSHTYNFYCMKYKGSKEPFSSSNLLYVSQMQSDANGNISVSYTPTEDYPTPSEFVVPMGQADLSAVQLMVEDKTYNGKEQFANPVLTNGTQTLTEGVDYELSGSYSAIEAGTYTVTASGIGDYTGVLTFSYEIKKEDFSEVDIKEIADVVYSGEAYEPNLSLAYGDLSLEEGTDYTVEYRNNTNAGTAVAILNGTKNYNGQKICLFQILPCKLTQDMVEEIPSRRYNGAPIEPSVALKRGNSALSRGNDYRVEYKNNIQIGTATITITGRGNYTGTIQANFEIEKQLEIADALPVFPALTYTGGIQSVKPAITFAQKTLLEGMDYELSGDLHPTDAGTYQVTITGKGDFTGKVTHSYKVLGADLAKASSEPLPACIYDGTPHTPEPIIIYQGRTLVKDRDYIVTYQNNTEVGIASVQLNGIGNYTGAISLQFSILDKTDIAAQHIYLPPLEYNGSIQRVAPIVTFDEAILKEGRDFQLSGTYEATDAGTYSFELQGIGIYKGSISLTYDIEKAQMKNATVADIPDCTYRGDPVKPQIKAFFNQILLEAGRDYTVEYHNNMAAGTGIAILKGQGNYSGQQICLFQILSFGTEKPAPSNPGNNKDPNNPKPTPTIQIPKKGQVLKFGKHSYKVTKKGQEIAFLKTANKETTLKIPETVKIEGITYKVTSIAAKAFSGNKKLKKIKIGNNINSIDSNAFSGCTSLATVTMGKGVKKIGKQAFSGCKKLKDITIKSTKLTSKSIGAKAFQGIYAKAIIKVPKAKKAAYQKLLKSKGISKKVKIK